jgi:phasin family protein
MANNNPFEAFQNFGEAFKNQSFNFENIAQAHQRNVEAANKAGQKFAENAQALARRNAEFLQQQAESGLKLVKELVGNANNPEAALAKQADFVKASVDASINNGREIFEQASKQSSEALDALNKQFNEFWKEAQKAGSAAAEAAGVAKKKSNAA